METLAIIVNYRVADMAVAAAESVLASDSVGPVRVVVVDNSEQAEEAERLRNGLPEEAELMTPARNIGFGQACNLAYRGFSGDCVLLLNPDARLLPACLSRLQRTLMARENAAAVGPLSFWDEQQAYYLPPSCPPSFFLFEPVLERFSPGSPVKRLMSAAWRRHAMRVWRADRPIRTRNLPGGNVLLKREAVERAGGLFDPRFFLYFEDLDLFMRLRKAGGALMIDPRARSTHQYDQCGQDNVELKRRRFMESRRLFLQKHLIGFSARASEIGCSLFSLPRFRTGPPDFTAPFRFEVPAFMQKGWLFEWSPNPDFIPAVGLFGRGPWLDFSDRHWSMLAPRRYFGRLGRVGGSCGAFREICWDKA